MGIIPRTATALVKRYDPMPDSTVALATASRRYAEALQRREAIGPDDPGYRTAVHAVGVAWGQLARAERRLASDRTRPSA